MKKSLSKASATKRVKFYKPGEIEQLCLDELISTGLYPTEPCPIRIERFVEKRFGTPKYAALSENVLGYTRFGLMGVPEIVISESLCDDSNPTTRRRLNTTLAHEAGHALLHEFYFSPNESEIKLILEGIDELQKKILCREPGIQFSRNNSSKYSDHEVMEIHANRAIGGFLLPKPLVECALESILATRGLLGKRILETERRGEAETVLSQTFDVNPVVARYRLDALFPEAQEDQMSL